jgi:hypothetical protein
MAPNAHRPIRRLVELGLKAKAPRFELDPRD